MNSNNALTADPYLSYYGGKTFYKDTTSTFASLFFNDMFTEFGGHLSWREVQSDSVNTLNNITDMIRVRYPAYNFAVKHAIILTLENAMQYGVGSSRNTMQQIFATNGTLTFGVMNVYQADSAYLSSAGYYDKNCGIRKTFPAYTVDQYEMYLDKINPIVVKFVGADCYVSSGKFKLTNED